MAIVLPDGNGLFQQDNAPCHTPKIPVQLNIYGMCWTNKSNTWRPHLQLAGLKAVESLGILGPLHRICYGAPSKSHSLLTKNINLTNERDGLLIKNDNLTKQREQFNQEINELVKSLHETAELLFTDGWLYYKFSLYFISYERKSWTESRRFCTEKGADLIIINSREEQNFVKSIAESTFVWIGLTDSDVEGKWKWVDGSNMISRFWVSGEPNRQRKENCAVSYSSGWYDYLCNTAYKWICEKSFVKYHIP
uniref:C-type lectin domain family 17, member A-like n=1 Tax=Sinocyclocheilus rhinocerous TaxID=307959 RepID=A0A673K2U9_9TELE